MHSHCRANKQWPCLPPFYLPVSYSIITKGNKRKWWTAGRGRCPSHILYLELVEIASMILCQLNKDWWHFKIASWLWTLWGQGLIHVSIAWAKHIVGGVSQAPDGEMFCSGSCHVHWRIFSYICALKPLIDGGTPYPRAVSATNSSQYCQCLLVEWIHWCRSSTDVE